VGARAAAPIQRAIEAGDLETGITIMQMDAGLDTGPMLMTERLPIDPRETTATLHDKLAVLGGRLIVEALEAAACGGLSPRVQPEAGVTYAHKIDKAEARIDWTQPAAAIERRIRAFDPQPGCWSEFDAEPLKIWGADVSAGFAIEPGSIKVQDGHVRVACGEGALELREVQRPGGRRQSASSWAAARR
jgi:methionyl-tRNA formyltransferase